VILTGLLSEAQVLVDFVARDKGEAIGKLVDVLVSEGKLTAANRATALEALLAREKVGSTGLEHGVALPHAIVDVPGDALAVLAVSAQGVPFHSADGQPARLLVQVLIPRRQVQKHLRTLAAVAKLLAYEETREALLRAKSPREALGVIRELEREAGGAPARG
jgi:mannitol/fructose-specific phosphotransferase system IIA component (Ntr-type)